MRLVARQYLAILVAAHCVEQENARLATYSTMININMKLSAPVDLKALAKYLLLIHGLFPQAFRMLKLPTTKGRTAKSCDGIKLKKQIAHMADTPVYMFRYISNAVEELPSLSLSDYLREWQTHSKLTKKKEVSIYFQSDETIFFSTTNVETTAFSIDWLKDLLMNFTLWHRRHSV